MQPVSQTAFYCAGVRARDAERPAPVVGDRFARLFLGDDGRAVFEKFRGLDRPHASNIARCRIVDDLLRDRLLADAARPVVLLGAGFDSRPYRLTGGHWLELDAEPVITRKEGILPVTRCPNPLERVPVDFSPAALREVLGRFRGAAKVTVVVEGVLMYLAPPKVDQLLQVLARAFPRHEILCDLMTARFAERFGGEIQQVIRELGATMEGLEPRPADRFREAGYSVTSRTSIPLRAAQLKALDVPPLVIRWFMPTLRDGYAVYAFERTA